MVDATILKRFEQPDEVREFEKGRLEVVTIAGRTLGRATYQPGWKWSLHVGPLTGRTRCGVEHLGIVLAGHATAAFDDGRVFDLTQPPRRGVIDARASDRRGDGLLPRQLVLRFGAGITRVFPLISPTLPATAGLVGGAAAMYFGSRGRTRCS